MLPKMERNFKKIIRIRKRRRLSNITDSLSKNPTRVSWIYYTRETLTVLIDEGIQHLKDIETQKSIFKIIHFECFTYTD